MNLDLSEVWSIKLEKRLNSLDTINLEILKNYRNSCTQRKLIL
jgi:hypothetical protein